MVLSLTYGQVQGGTITQPNPVITNIQPSHAGTYTVIVTDPEGRSTTASTTVSVVSIDTTVIRADAFLIVAQGSAAYRWYDCSNPSATLGTQQIFVPAQPGSYAVEISYQGCTSQSSCHYFIPRASSLSAPHPALPTVQLFPNPAENTLTVRVQNSIYIPHFRILDMEGGELLKQVVPNQLIDVSSLPVGVYVVEVEIEAQKTYHTLLIVR